MLYTVCVAVAWLSVHVGGQCLSEGGAAENELEEAYSTMEYAVADFSFSLLRQFEVPSSSRGLFLGPFSVWSALALIYFGAKGNTEAEIAKVLRVQGQSKASISQAYHNLHRLWKTNLAVSNSTYRLSNRIYFSRESQLRPCFLKDFPEEISQVDFKTQPEESRGEINAWVEKETNSKIQELVPPDAITPFTQMVVANAIYFKGNWLQMFDSKFTKRMRFTTSDLSFLHIDTMYLRGSFFYAIDDDLRMSIIELPYSGKDLSMLILLPQNYVSGLKRLIQRLTPEILSSLMGSMVTRDVTVYVPKFRIESTFEMSTPLKAMGLRDLFDPGSADISGFTGKRDLALDSVHHKSFVEVTEQGTEAAAATAFLTSRTARPVGPAAFIADRPFLFLIKDNVFNLIVFAGTVQRPGYP